MGAHRRIAHRLGALGAVHLKFPHQPRELHVFARVSPVSRVRLSDACQPFSGSRPRAQSAVQPTPPATTQRRTLTRRAAPRFRPAPQSRREITDGVAVPQPSTPVDLGFVNLSSRGAWGNLLVSRRAVDCFSKSSNGAQAQAGASSPYDHRQVEPPACDRRAAPIRQCGQRLYLKLLPFVEAHREPTDPDQARAAAREAGRSIRRVGDRSSASNSGFWRASWSRSSRCHGTLRRLEH